MALRRCTGGVFGAGIQTGIGWADMGKRFLDNQEKEILGYIFPMPNAKEVQRKTRALPIVAYS